MNLHEPRSVLHLTLLSLGVAVAYAVTGKLGLLLAIPPGYATAIWPPSGIALAAILIYGYRVWPGVLLGSFVVNFWTGFDASTVSANLLSLAVPIGIGSGAALQAVVGAFLVRRFAAFPNSLSNEREIFSFLFWGGPASCFVNATIGVLVLIAAGKVPVSNFLINTGTWWIGDSIGVFIFTPLVLVWTLRPFKVWKPRRITVTLPMVITFALAIAAVAFTANWERQQLTRQFEKQAAGLAGTLDKALIVHVEVLRSLERFYAASVHIDRNGFRTFVDRSLLTLSGLQAVGWDPRVLNSDRAKFEFDIQQEGFPGFQITERNAEGQLVRAAERPEYIPVQYIEPFEKNEKAFGYDLGSSPTRRKGLDLARDTGKPIASARIMLVQETSQQFGVLMFMPIYRNGLPHDTLEARRLNLAGYMVGVFRAGDIVNAALRDVEKEGVVYRLVDESAPLGKQLLFETQSQRHGIVTLDKKSIFGSAPPISRSFPIVVGGRQWKFEAFPNQEYIAQNRPKYIWLILIAGMLLTSLVGTFAIAISGRSYMLRELVDQRTDELRQITSDAEKANAAKTEFLSSMSHELRTPLNAIIGYSEMLNMNTFGPLGSDKNQEYVSDINVAGAHLLALINDVLDLSRIEAGKEEVAARETDVHFILAECLEMVAVLAEQRQISINHGIPNFFPTVKVDSRHFSQILINLLSNAIKFTPEGGAINVNVAVEKDRSVTIKVIDTGVGISAEDIPRVLKKFERAGDLYTRTETGTGLGLPLTKKLVELNGGTITLESEVGKGTTVTVRFPG